MQKRAHIFLNYIYISCYFGDILWKSGDIVPFEINSNIESLLFDFLSIYTN